MATEETLARVAQSRSFDLSEDAGLPPLPGAPAPAEADAPALACRLWELLKAAGHNRILAPAHRGDTSLPDGFEAIMTSATEFEVMPGVALADVLWIRSAPYWNGELARRLSEMRGDAADASVPGAVLLFAQGAGRRAALLGHAQPFVVAEAILGSFDVPGPYLVLVVCEVDPLGKARALRGYAQPILNAQHFMPVASAFERDVFQALIALQAKLDAHGLECTVSRALSPTGPGQDIEIAVEHENGERLVLHAVLCPDDGTKSGGRKDQAAPYIITPRRFADGSFLAWLEGELVAVPGAKGEGVERPAG